MAKETLSPKVKNAGRRPKRGTQPGDKSVTRSKRRGTGIARVVPGQDILSAAREERNARRESHRPSGPTKPYVEKFTEAFATRVIGTAKDQHWSNEARKAACDYIKSLTIGDGSMPEALPDAVARSIQWHFAMVCAKMQPTTGRFAGMNQPWFEAEHKRALGVLRWRQSNRHLAATG